MLLRTCCLVGLLVTSSLACVMQRFPCPAEKSSPCSKPTAANLAPVPAPSASFAGASVEFPDQSERLELFHSLTESARKYHVFSTQTEKNLGRRWQDDLPTLEREFASADTLGKLTTALYHFQNSLHNRHCSYEPRERSRRQFAGFSANVEWVGGKPVFYVEDIYDSSLGRQLSPGDIVVSMDGIPAQEFLLKFSLESNANNVTGLAYGVARFLGSRLIFAQSGAPDPSTTWQFQKRGRGDVFQLTTSWTGRPSSKASTESDPAPAYEKLTCGDLPDRNYGPYKLKELGINYCLYASHVAPFRAYPIVRHFSFDYSSDRFTQHMLRAEQRSLQARLGAISGAKGVILDLRDNHGGNNPNWFFDWYAPAPYYDHFVAMRLHSDFDSEQRLREARVTGWGAEDISAYLQALKNRKPGDDFSPRRPFFCRPDTCNWDNHYVPTHQVTKLPLALLVGSDCVSACDEFAQVFSENGFGPLIGEQPAHAFTAYRMRHPVKTPRTHLDLGAITFAFSNDFSGKTGEEVEARSLRIDYPVDRTFANRAQFDAILVSTAVDAFREFHFSRLDQPRSRSHSTPTPPR